MYRLQVSDRAVMGKGKNTEPRIARKSTNAEREALLDKDAETECEKMEIHQRNSTLTERRYPIACSEKRGKKIRSFRVFCGFFSLVETFESIIAVVNCHVSYEQFLITYAFRYQFTNSNWCFQML